MKSSLRNLVNSDLLSKQRNVENAESSVKESRPPAISATGLISLLIRTSKAAAFTAIAAGVIGGVSSASIIAVINTTLHKTDGPASVLLWSFIGLCLIRLLASVASSVLLIYLDQEIILDLRLRLSRQILNAPLRRLEEIGPQRLWGAVGGDIFNITAAVTNVPLFCIHLASTIGCFLYLAWLSWRVFFIVVAFVGVGLVINQVLVRSAVRYVKIAREKEDALLKQFHSLIYGVKELKLHLPRREAFFSKILRVAALSFRKHIVIGMTLFTAANTWGSLLFYIVIGLLLFGLPISGNAANLAAYTLTLIYMMNSLTGITSTFPVLGRASVALRNLQNLGVSLNPKDEKCRLAVSPNGDHGWKQIELVNVTHTYYQQDLAKSFTLGPVDLAFEPGELVFLAGGNGSGKTTLAKLLTGLYIPESGEIRIDGMSVTDESRDDYCQKFSAIFSDFYLFDRVLGDDGPDLDSRIRERLVELQLDNKVEVEEGVFSTIDLSQGQRKRLALLSAYLEDRPFYVFDEWAADQDPVFRDVFYLQILPELKLSGKTVLVISHDDRYYHLADRLIKLEYGQVQYAVRNDGANSEGKSEGAEIEVFPAESESHLSEEEQAVLS
jgi:putative pyoverdin transport system ATP-binding/permease protein